MEKNKQLDVIYLVEWLLKKLHSNNLYVKLSAVRSLANFSRYSKAILVFIKIKILFNITLYYYRI